MLMSSGSVPAGGRRAGAVGGRRWGQCRGGGRGGGGGRAARIPGDQLPAVTSSSMLNGN